MVATLALRVALDVTLLFPKSEMETPRCTSIVSIEIALATSNPVTCIREPPDTRTETPPEKNVELTTYAAYDHPDGDATLTWLPPEMSTLQSDVNLQDDAVITLAVPWASSGEASTSTRLASATVNVTSRSTTDPKTVRQRHTPPRTLTVVMFATVKMSRPPI